MYLYLILAIYVGKLCPNKNLQKHLKIVKMSIADMSVNPKHKMKVEKSKII